MTTETIAFNLCSAQSAEGACRFILPADQTCQEYDDAITDAWRQVKTLERQRAELCRLMPAKASQFINDFHSEVLRLAGVLHEQLFEVTP